MQPNTETLRPWRVLAILKWSGTAAIIMATISRSLNWHATDLVLSLLGSLCWCTAGWLYRDRALVSLNAFSILVLLLGIYNALR